MTDLQFPALPVSGTLNVMNEISALTFVFKRLGSQNPMTRHLEDDLCRTHVQVFSFGLCDYQTPRLAHYSKDHTHPAVPNSTESENLSTSVAVAL